MNLDNLNFEDITGVNYLDGKVIIFTKDAVYSCDENVYKTFIINKGTIDDHSDKT